MPLKSACPGFSIRFRPAYNGTGDDMNALEMTTAVHTIAVAIAADLSNEDLELLATVLSQISSVFATI